MKISSVLETVHGSLLVQRIMGYWRRTTQMVTASLDRYRNDPFFRTETTIVVLQFGFALFLLVVVWIIAQQLYHDASAAVIQGMHEAFVPHASPSAVGASVIDDLSSMRSRTVLLAAGVVIAVTALFTYIITRIALSPTRNALASQRQFIGNIAHELRTPLAIGKTNIEVALMSPSIDAALKGTLVHTKEELDRISEIIDNLLSLSASLRPERIEFGDTDLGTVIEGVMRNLRDLADSKRIELEARMSERRVVWGNRTALQQIVMNVLKNALVYTADRGRILITVEPVYPDLMEFSVQDPGKGITRKNLFRIFEPYFRADPSRTRGESGSGLGLAIVSELVKLHNGKITVRSAAGRGTTVTILLPAGKSPIRARDRTDREHDTASEIAIDFSHGNEG